MPIATEVGDAQQSARAAAAVDQFALGGFQIGQ